MDGKGEVASEAGSGGGSGLGWQGVPGRYEATCHPRLGGCLRSEWPCAAGQAGVAGAALVRRGQRDEGAEEAAGGGGGMAGARATLGIVRGGTVNGSERQ